MIIGLCGYARSGKDTAGRVLVEEYGFVKQAFADPLREMALAIDPMISLIGAAAEILTDIRDRVDPDAIICDWPARYRVILDAVGYERAKTIPDFRRFLQRLGTEGARGCLWDSIWIDAFERRLPKHLSVVVTDVRFPNEAAWIEKHGELWRIERAGIDALNAHESEKYITAMMPKRTIVNDSTVSVFEDRVRATIWLAQHNAI